MSCAGREALLADLREQIGRLDGSAKRTASVLPFGIEAVDGHLPDHGLALGALHEFLEAGPASEHAAIATLFVGGVLARLDGPVLWCLRGRDLFAPALSRLGLHPDRVIYCETWKDAEVLPAMEEGLRQAGLAGVVGEVGSLPPTAGRRLQLAAEASGAPALIIRRFRTAHDQSLAGEPTVAVTRWRLSAAPSPALSVPGLARARWRVELLRCRSGEPHSWVLESCDAKGRLALPADLADRPSATQRRRRAAA